MIQDPTISRTSSHILSQVEFLFSNCSQLGMLQFIPKGERVKGNPQASMVAPGNTPNPPRYPQREFNSVSDTKIPSMGDLPGLMRCWGFLPVLFDADVSKIQIMHPTRYLGCSYVSVGVHHDHQLVAHFLHLPNLFS
jgi:hypothetical protein